MAPSGLYARLCHAFLVLIRKKREKIFSNIDFVVVVVFIAQSVGLDRCVILAGGRLLSERIKSSHLLLRRLGGRFHILSGSRPTEMSIWCPKGLMSRCVVTKPGYMTKKAVAFSDD